MNLAARFALVVVRTAAYLGLAIWGRGGAAFFANPARTALAILTFAMAIVAMFAGRNLSSGVRDDRRNRWVLAAFTLIGLPDGFEAGSAAWWPSNPDTHWSPPEFIG
jgi:hypothetical protein